eukprot:TRINITY_DN4581_c0_g1_i1.p1 TRINITY_DN4581_c0_g1~~TRINITY_DN4581_c0_g1_i1.p1  ORF type:complete len:670 (-),score=122.34 TRINITY_DN4581_c0_g1_i1:13-2022(-)
MAQDIPRVHCPSLSHFHLNFVLTNRPVVLTGMVDQWPAMEKWDQDYVKDKTQDFIVSLKTSPNGLFPSWSQQVEERRDMTFHQFLDTIYSDSPKEFHMLSGDQTHLLDKSGINPHFKKLWADIEPLPVVPMERINSVGLWFSNKGAKSSLHYDGCGSDNLNVQVRGQKKVHLYAPDLMERMYLMQTQGRHNFSHVEDIENVDRSRFPDFPEHPTFETTLKQGEVLFIPSFWFHSLTHEGPMNLNVNFWWAPKTLILNDLSIRSVLMSERGPRILKSLFATREEDKKQGRFLWDYVSGIAGSPTETEDSEKNTVKDEKPEVIITKPTPKEEEVAEASEKKSTQIEVDSSGCEVLASFSVPEEYSRADYSRPGLQSLISPMSPETFFSEFWTKKPFVVHGSLDRFANLRKSMKDWDLVRMLKHVEGKVPFQMWGSTTDGRPIHMNVDSLRQALPLYDSGWTLYVQHLFQLGGPWLDALLADLKYKPLPRGYNPRVPQPTFGLFASRKDGTPTDWHFDAIDNFTLQIRGTKTWSILSNKEVSNVCTNYQNRPLSGKGFPGAIPGTLPKNDFSAAATVKLVPGSVLFNPAGSWHAVKASEDSLSITFTMPRQCWAQLMGPSIERFLYFQDFWREECGSDFLENKEHLAQVLAERLQEDLKEFKGSDLIAEPFL